MIYRILSAAAAFILSTQLWAEAIPSIQDPSTTSQAPVVNKLERKMTNKINDQYRKKQRQNKEYYKQKSVDAAGLIKH